MATAPTYCTHRQLKDVFPQVDSFDNKRAIYIKRYIYAMYKAMQEGANIEGYFYWSLMDNFEWAEGYDMKFGLYEVDFNTQKRTLRKGARVFVDIVNE